ncbi:MAG: ABC transporter ATP-binding protein [Planctomycetes bacterium]|nr:ABC transporter ATP-binding protein [Planctomycetota bacterium]
MLILDEATSAIDAQSERLIHEALRNFTKGRITFLITHSVSQSILDFVTRVVVMDQGKLIASGPHEELIRTCPVYQRLYKAQIQQKTVHDEQQELLASSAETSQPQASTESEPHVGPPHIIPLHPEIGRQTDRLSVLQSTDSPDTAESADEEPGSNPSGIA